MNGVAMPPHADHHSRNHGIDGERIWEDIRRAALAEAEQEPLLAGYLYDYILRHGSFANALCHNLSSALTDKGMTDATVHHLVVDTLEATPQVIEASLWDLEATVTRDPAAHEHLLPFLYYKGFRALQCWRVSHGLWQQGRKSLAHFLQSRISEVFSIDIHPAARIGCGVFIDHGTGIVIGETAVVEENVSLLHNVTLGGTGKEAGDRHPKIRRGVLVGAGAKILGNIEVGICSKVASGSVVLDNVPDHCTVAGVPARVVATTRKCTPALDMSQAL